MANRTAATRSAIHSSGMVTHSTTWPMVAARMTMSTSSRTADRRRHGHLQAAPRCRSLLTGAKATSSAHEKATGFPNDALVAYIQASQHEAGCPA